MTDIDKIKCEWYVKHILKVMMNCHVICNSKKKEKNND